jgi:hypothetical protein
MDVPLFSNHKVDFKYVLTKNKPMSVAVFQTGPSFKPFPFSIRIFLQWNFEIKGNGLVIVLFHDRTVHLIPDLAKSSNS